jgi:hypothetical protein
VLWVPVDISGLPGLVDGSFWWHSLVPDTIPIPIAHSQRRSMGAWVPTADRPFLIEFEIFLKPGLGAAIFWGGGI